MNRRTKKKHDKQLFAKIWQRDNEPWVKHWSVAYKHSRKYYEEKKKQVLGCRNAMDIPLIEELDRRIPIGTLRGAVILSKKDIFGNENIIHPTESILDQIWKATHDI